MSEPMTLDALRAKWPDVSFRLTERAKGVSFVVSKGASGMSGSTNSKEAALLAMTLAAPVIATESGLEYAREQALEDAR